MNIALPRINPEREAEQRRKAHVEALKAEADRLAGDGSVRALTVAVTTLESEQAGFRDQLTTLRALSDLNYSEHGAAFAAGMARASDVALLIGDFRRSLSEARAREGNQKASEFTRAKPTVELYSAALQEWAIGLEAAAALANAHDAAVQAGALVSSMPPLPGVRMQELRALELFVKDVRRMGVKLDLGKLPAAIRQRVS